MPAEPQLPPDRYFLGLDLGQSQDYSALVALRRRAEPDPRPRHAGATRFRYTVLGIKRWPLGTPYPVVVSDTVALVIAAPLAGCLLAVDRTGVGQGVVGFLCQAGPNALVRSVFITNGNKVNSDGYQINIPKRELVAAVQILLETARLGIPATSPEATLLGRELLTFRAKITSTGHESLEADWRTKAHDDLVLALAMAAWFGENVMADYTGPLDFYPAPPDLERMEQAKPMRVLPLPDLNPARPVPEGYTRVGSHNVKIEDDEEGVRWW